MTNQTTFRELMETLGWTDKDNVSLIIGDDLPDADQVEVAFISDTSAYIILNNTERRYVVEADTDTMTCATCDHDCDHADVAHQEVAHAFEAVVES